MAHEIIKKHYPMAPDDPAAGVVPLQLAASSLVNLRRLA
jgi:hypothetical protein